HEIGQLLAGAAVRGQVGAAAVRHPGRVLLLAGGDPAVGIEPRRLRIGLAVLQRGPDAAHRLDALGYAHPANEVSSFTFAKKVRGRTGCTRRDSLQTRSR